MPIQESFNTASSVSGNIQYLFDQKDKGGGEAGNIMDALSGGSETLYQRTTKVDDKLGMILSEIKMINTHLATSDASKMFSEGLDQSAILAVELDATGDAKSFMSSLERIAQLDDINLISVSNGLDSIGMSLDNIIKKDYTKFQPIITSLESFSGGLTKFSQSLPSFKQLAGIAGGIALLGLSVAAFSGGIGMDDVLTMGIVFGMVAIASRLLKGTKRNLLKASFGVATLGLSIWAFNKLVDANEILGFGTTLLGIGAAVSIFDKVFSKSAYRTGKSIQALSFGVATLGVGMLGFNFVEWESIPKAIAAMTGLGLVAFGLSKIKNEAPTRLIGLSIAVGVMGVSLKLFKDISASDVGVAMLALGGTAVAAYALSKIGKSGLVGAAVLAATGGAMVFLAYGLKKMANIGLTFENAGVIALTIGLTAAAFAALGIPVVAGLIGVGAIVALGMGAALATLSLGLNAINSVNVTPEQAAMFATSVMNVKDAITGIGDVTSMPSLLLGIATAALVTGATLPLVLAANMVAKVNNPSKEVLEGFGNTVISLKDIFTEFGLLELGKLALVTPVMLLMATTTVALGGAISLFTKLSTSPESAQGAVDTLDTFLGGLNTTYSKYDDSAFENLKKGIDATMSLGNLLKNLAYGIGAISGEMEKNTDFEAIGVSVGKMLTALTNPLAAIGGKNDTISIGGFEVTNPFSNKVQEGVEALSGLGMVFTPLVDMLKIFTEDTDGSVVDKFSVNIRGIIGTLSDVFTNFSLGDDDQSLDMMFKATDKASSFVKTLTGSNYEPAQKGLMSIAASTKNMQVAVNEMDLERLTKLNDLFFNLNQLEEGDGIQAILDALGELIKTMENASANIQNTETVENVINTTQQENTPDTTKNVSSGDDIDIAGLISKSNGDVVKIMEDLTNFVKSGQLKVIAKNSPLI